MTNFEKMKYLHRNTGKKKTAGNGAEEAGKKMTKTSRTKKGAEDEECRGNPPEDIPG